MFLSHTVFPSQDLKIQDIENFLQMMPQGGKDSEKSHVDQQALQDAAPNLITVNNSNPITHANIKLDPNLITENTNNFNKMLGMSAAGMNSGLGNVDIGAFNPNMLNPIQMNPFAMQGMMNPFMNAGMQVPSTCLGGVNPFQSNMMFANMANTMGMMGMMGNLNGMSGMGNTMGMNNGSSNISVTPAAGRTSAPNARENTCVSMNQNDLLAQFFQNPMNANVMQGLNPMMMMTGQSQTGMNNSFGTFAGLNPAMFLSGMSNWSGSDNRVPLSGTVGGPESNWGYESANFGQLNLAQTAPAGKQPKSSLAQSIASNPLHSFEAINASGVLGVNDGLLKTDRKVKKLLRRKVKGKPKRPLSAYNLFFKDERERILMSIPKKVRSDLNKEEEDDKREISGEEDGPDMEDESQIKDFDQKGKNGKKIPHGKIGFEILAKQIGKRWQELKPDEIEKYKKLADEDMKRYKEEMEMFLTKEGMAGVEHPALSQSLLAIREQSKRQNESTVSVGSTDKKAKHITDDVTSLETGIPSMSKHTNI